MKIIETWKNFITTKPEISFFIKLIFLNIVFYIFNFFWTGLCVPNNIYWNFADKYLDYHDALIYTLKYSVKAICSLLGYETYFSINNKISIVHGRGVGIANACSGAGVILVWIAFVLAYPELKLRKLKWLFGGLFAIWFINVIRILALLLAVNQGKTVDINKFGEHHDVFNVIAYGLIIIMIYFYTKSSVQKNAPQKAA
jgi:exosortase/archaeosortase family protein